MFIDDDEREADVCDECNEILDEDGETYYDPTGLPLCYECWLNQEELEDF